MSYTAPLYVNARALCDAMRVLSGDLKDVDPAELATSCERYWTAKVWRAAITQAQILLSQGVHWRDITPIRPKLLPKMLYFTDYIEIVVVLESRFLPSSSDEQIDVHTAETKLGSYELNKRHLEVIEAEIEYLGL